MVRSAAAELPTDGDDTFLHNRLTSFAGRETANDLTILYNIQTDFACVFAAAVKRKSGWTKGLRCDKIPATSFDLSRPSPKHGGVRNSADGPERGQMPRTHPVGPGFVRVEGKPRIVKPPQRDTTKRVGRPIGEGRVSNSQRDHAMPCFGFVRGARKMPRRSLNNKMEVFLCANLPPETCL